MHQWVDKFGIVLVHNFLLDDGVILALLRELGEEEQQLRRQDDLNHQRVEDSHAGPRVHRGKREKHDVY